jgi:hypothetical protein
MSDTAIASIRSILTDSQTHYDLLVDRLNVEERSDMRHMFWLDKACISLVVEACYRVTNLLVNGKMPVWPDDVAEIKGAMNKVLSLELEYSDIVGSHMMDCNSSNPYAWTPSDCDRLSLALDRFYSRHEFWYESYNRSGR